MMKTNQKTGKIDNKGGIWAQNNEWFLLISSMASKERLENLTFAMSEAA